MKRLIAENTGPGGTLDTDKMLRAMLQYRNTPDPDTGLSPAEIIFGRQIRDFTPVLPGKYKPRDGWVRTLERREEALSRRHVKDHERWSEHTKRLPPLKVGDNVFIQNQEGNHPRRWEKSGLVVEVKQHNQYVVKNDGSGRTTMRNRKFLRKFTPYNKLIKFPVVQPHTPTYAAVTDPKSEEKPRSPPKDDQTITTRDASPRLPPILTPYKNTMSSPVLRPSAPVRLNDNNEEQHNLQPSTPMLRTPARVDVASPSSLPRVRLNLNEATPSVPAKKPAAVTVTRSGRMSKPVERYDPSAGGGR